MWSDTVLQKLPKFLRADWLIFIINKSTDGQNFNLYRLLSSTFSCQTANFSTSKILLPFWVANQKARKVSF